MPASLFPVIQAYLKSVNSLLGLLAQILGCVIPDKCTQLYTHNDTERWILFAFTIVLLVSDLDVNVC